MEHDDAIERVRCEVRSMLQAGELGPGERVNELHLAQRLNIGRNITREALRTLEYAGIVRIVPNKGVEVRKLSMEEALDLYEIRAGFARVAGRAAARRADRSEIMRLNELQKQLADIITTGDDLAYNKTNIAFHAALMAATHNPRLITMNAALEDELRLFMTRGTYTPGALRESLAEHQDIITAIEEGRPEEAGAAFERHILNGRQRLIDGQIVMML